jgi:two-component system, NarL family, nitrate/nitrite response regulator NarL
VSKIITAIVVTPRVVLREGLASLLQNTPYEVTACAAGPADLQSICRPKGQRTLAIVGVEPQKGNPDQTAECIRLLRSLIPDAKVVLVAEGSAPAELQDALALSPDACIFNLSSRDVLTRVLELALLDQQVFVTGKSVATAARDSTSPIGSEKDNVVTTTNSPTVSYRRGIHDGAELSPRECDVLACLAQGKSNKAIARIYNLSEATVKVHLKAILRKTKVHNRTQAAIWAITHLRQDGNGNMLAHASSLSPAATIPRVEYNGEGGVIGASRDNGLPPVPPSAHHPGFDRPQGR